MLTYDDAATCGYHGRCSIVVDKLLPTNKFWWACAVGDTDDVPFACTRCGMTPVRLPVEEIIVSDDEPTVAPAMMLVDELHGLPIDADLHAVHAIHMINTDWAEDY